MVSPGDIILNIVLFFSIYVQVFFLVTFIENRKKIIVRNGKIKLKDYPAVTIIVPCWNEADTIQATVRSIFDLNYPSDKIMVFLIDDGSTDDTWNSIQKFSQRQNVRIFRKANGGKHTALNLGLLYVQTDFLACLDADSVAHPESLVRLMSYFENYPHLMAVMPSIVVKNPSNIIESAQRAEYYLGVFIKRMLGFLGAIYVTPGPLTVFRKKVFNDLGPYRHAHNTEDMEIACRMQKYHYPIEHCNDAYVYTDVPSTIYQLYRQRLRWLYGFINNTIDYRSVLFKKKYGNFSVFTLPAGIISILAVSFFLSNAVYNFAEFVSSKISEFSLVGFNLAKAFSKFDVFFIKFDFIVFTTLIIYLVVTFCIIFGRKMALGKGGLPLDIIYFFSVFGIVAPFWFAKAIYNTILARAPSWR